jgi:cbb3-type cytochrome oxidase subunit 3
MTFGGFVCVCVCVLREGGREEMEEEKLSITFPTLREAGG